MKSRLPILTMFILALAHAAFAQTNVWDPIPANELQMTKPVVDPGADARLNDKLLANWSWGPLFLRFHVRRRQTPVRSFPQRGFVQYRVARDPRGAVTYVSIKG